MSNFSIIFMYLCHEYFDSIITYNQDKKKIVLDEEIQITGVSSTDKINL